MCGISGIVSADPAEAHMERLRSMTDALTHRGPDGEGYWQHPSLPVLFGHRRLAVMDLTPSAAQPFSFQDRYTLVFNGEIYNYLEIKNILLQKGYHFRTHSDTEVLVAAYDCWKEACLQYFDGMFAFAIWEESSKRLFVARDRFGEKPLYYAQTTSSFLFASECKALWRAGVSRAPNHLMLLNYFANGHTQNALDGTLTFFKEILQVPPAHYGIYEYRTHRFTLQQYWDLDSKSEARMSEEETVEKWLELFQNSVMRRLRSEVPIGTSLSGGLDSSAVAAMIAEVQKKSGEKNLYSRHAFTAVFPGFEKNEQRYAETVAKALQLHHHTVVPDAEGLLKDWDKLCYHQEQPFTSASVYVQFKVMELAQQQGVTVLLDGQGADETLAGYSKYIHWYLQELVARKQWGKFQQEKKQFQQHQLAFDWGTKNFAAAFLPLLTSVSLESKERKRIFSHPHLSRDYAHAHYDKYFSIYKPPVSRLNDILYFNTMQQGLNELLHYADRNSMAFGRELRLPFLSHELVAFTFSLPSAYKLHDGFSKWVLRKSIVPYLPGEIVWRTDKIGFEPPQQQWMQHPSVKERIMEAKKNWVAQGILRKSALEEPTFPVSAYNLDNFDWRYWCAAQMF
ncbi:MAG: asparagine synthase (glutamine-hydrolyzing) [Bacteroidetes bacterium]|nr:asparagine synthase (glutamine-hydrolyzing) [Bacteroidota bacterium]